MELDNVFCRQWTSEGVCNSNDFIFHPNGGIQCSKCGKYFNEEAKRYYDFFSKYRKQKQGPIIDRELTQRDAKLFATLYGEGLYFDFKELQVRFRTTTTLSNLSNSDLLRYVQWDKEEVERCYYSSLDKSVYTQWIDIYKDRDEKPIFVFHLHCVWEDLGYNNLWIDEEMLLIGDNLPTNSSRAPTTTVVPVKNPDQLVYTGATVGGITTGGFHTQSGGYHVETVDVPGFREETFYPRGFSTSFTLRLYRLDVYDHSKLPGRYIARSQPMDVWKIINVPEAIQLSERDLKNTIVFKDMSIPLLEDILFDHVSDEEYYEKAVELSKTHTKEALTRAGGMFSALKDYKDSKLRSETCYYDAKSAPSEPKEKDLRPTFGALFILSVIISVCAAWVSLEAGLICIGITVILVCIAAQYNKRIQSKMDKKNKKNH